LEGAGLIVALPITRSRTVVAVLVVIVLNQAYTSLAVPAWDCIVASLSVTDQGFQLRDSALDRP
jgi:hypothetical protein